MQRFADEWILCMDGKEAATKAGYSPKTAAYQASRMLKNVKLREYIETRKKEIEEILRVSKITVVRDLLAVKDRCMQAEEVLDSEGNPTGEYKFDSRGAVKALEQVAKSLGYNAPEKVDVTTGGQRVQAINFIIPKEVAAERASQKKK